MKYIPNGWKPYKNRILCALIGVLIAILILTIGFGKTFLICLLTGIGFLIGYWLDGKFPTEKLEAFIDYFRR